MRNNFLNRSNDTWVHLGRCFLRMGIGIVFLFHGLPKIAGGLHEWHIQGEKINFLGIHFYPVFFGFLSAFTEFFGGIFLIVGFLIRPFTFMLLINMIVAMFYLLSKGVTYEDYSDPLELIFVFIAIFIMGPDKYAGDHYLYTRFHK